MSKTSLSLEQYKLLDNAYKLFNEKLFDNNLPDCMIVLHRKKNAYGYFHAERYVDRASIKASKKSYDELALNPDDFNRPDIAILSTLAHEMCHVWQYRCTEKHPRNGYHDKVWAKKMEEIGLMPSTTGDEKGKKTGQRVSHYIIQAGRFESYCLKFLKQQTIKLSSFALPPTSSSNKKNKIAYCCPSCDLKVWGKPEIVVRCGQCDEELLPE